jgi:hypothetical protein
LLQVFSLFECVEIEEEEVVIEVCLFEAIQNNINFLYIKELKSSLSLADVQS